MGKAHCVSVPEVVGFAACTLNNGRAPIRMVQFVCLAFNKRHFFRFKVSEP